jgi:hypothetical protein
MQSMENRRALPNTARAALREIADNEDDNA